MIDFIHNVTPGYFVGAIYVNYAFTVGITIAGVLAIALVVRITKGLRVRSVPAETPTAALPE